MLIALLTDFGTRDAFVGTMKGVIKGIAPGADLVDLTHEIPPQDVLTGAFVLGTSYRYFPPGTIHLAVVDPGVGGDRRPVAARLGDWLFVGPDNGLLSYVSAEATLHEVVVLENPAYRLPDVSRTFHGRDVFAPAAAHLARGVPLSALGPPAGALTTLTTPHSERDGDALRCHVLYTDVYGNAFTDLTEQECRAWTGGAAFTAEANGHTLSGPVEAYSAVAEGAPLAIFGSSGYLEIAVRNGSAREKLRLARGAVITLRRSSP